MSSRGETHPAFDPLDEEYALAPPVQAERPRRALDTRVAPPETPPLSPSPTPATPMTNSAAIDESATDDAAHDDAAHDELTVPPADPARFTLRNLLTVITLASVVMAVGIRFPRPYFAGVAGVAALATAVSASWLRHSGAVMQLAWWTLLAIYLMACGFALLGI